MLSSIVAKGCGGDHQPRCIFSKLCLKLFCCFSKPYQHCSFAVTILDVLAPPCSVNLKLLAAIAAYDYVGVEFELSVLHSLVHALIHLRC
jgi:hypothetical protein